MLFYYVRENQSKSFLLFCFFHHGYGGVRAQDITVSGVVVEVSSERTLPGVNILIKSEGRGTTTNADGEYEIVVPSDATVVFSFVGFETKEVSCKRTFNHKCGADGIYAGFGRNVRLRLYNAIENTRLYEYQQSYDSPILQSGYRNINTDWQDMAFRQGMTIKYEASASGGSENTTFYISGNYKHHDNLLEVVLEERRLELAFEGHRKYDLLRNNRSIIRNYPGTHLDPGETTQVIEPNAPRIVLYIPESEIELNKNLVQNP